MENKQTRISVDEFLDIIGYALGEEYSRKMKRHWSKYGSWIRVKDIVTKDLILQRKEGRDTIKRLKTRLDEVEPLLQEEIFSPRSTESARITLKASSGV